MDDFTDSINKLFENGFWAAFIASAVIALLAWLLIFILNKTLKRMAELGRVDKTGAAYFRRIVVAVVVLLAGMGILMQVKPLKSVGASLLASSGVIAVILGFAAQQAMANIVGGFFISVFRPFSLGDRVRLPGHDIEGVVEDISLRHTVIRTFENNRVIVPNSVMNAAVIENSQYRDGKVLKFLDIGVHMGADIERAMRVMREEARAHRDFLDNRTEQERRAGMPDVTVRMTSLSGGVANLRASIWARDAATGYAMACDLLLSIKKRFDAEGIDLPNPLPPPPPKPQ
jgi:small conductance mechanosensitive channel